MAGGYVAAWLVAALAAMLAAGLLVAALRHRRPWLGYLAAGLVLAWALVPYRFDGEHWAPAIVVGLFRLWFEENANPQPPLLLLAAATAVVLALGCVGLGAAALARAWPRRRRRPHGRRRNTVE